MGKKLQKKNKKQKHNQNCNKRRNKSHLDHPNPIKISISEKKEDDLISRLPDDILCRIILLLPLKCAVQTSFLSIRWRNLWNKALTLHGAIEDMEKVISAFLDPLNWHVVLSNHRGLQYHFSQSGILQATIKDNKELHLNFSDRKKEIHEQQFRWRVRLYSIKQAPLPSCFLEIKILRLTSLNKLTEKVVSSLITNLWLLESLEITKCKGLQSLYIPDSSELQSLTILDCPILNQFYSDANNLRAFQFQGLLSWFRLKYFPYMEDVMLDLREGLGYCPGCDNLFFLLKAVCNVKTLTICGWLFEVPISWLQYTNRFVDEYLRFIKLKELWWISSSMEEHDMIALVSFLKICPLLERLFITISPTRGCNSGKKKCSFWTEHPKLIANYYTRLARLGMVKLEGFTHRKDEILLVERLLKEVVSDQPLIIITTLHENGWNGTWSQQMVRIPCGKKNGPKTYKMKKKVWDFLREDPKNAERQHLDMKYHREFVEDEKNKLGFTHPHMGLL